MVVGFPGGSDGKESACSAGDLVREEPLEKGMATHSLLRVGKTTPVFLPGEFQRRRSLVDYSAWGRKKTDTTEGLTLSLFFFFILMVVARIQNQFYVQSIDNSSQWVGFANPKTTHWFWKSANHRLTSIHRPPNGNQSIIASPKLSLIGRMSTHLDLWKVINPSTPYLLKIQYKSSRWLFFWACATLLRVSNKFHFVFSFHILRVWFILW